MLGDAGYGDRDYGDSALNSVSPGAVFVFESLEYVGGRLGAAGPSIGNAAGERTVERAKAELTGSLRSRG